MKALSRPTSYQATETIGLVEYSAVVQLQVWVCAGDARRRCLVCVCSSLSVSSRIHIAWIKYQRRVGVLEKTRVICSGAFLCGFLHPHLLSSLLFFDLQLTFLFLFVL